MANSEGLGIGYRIWWNARRAMLSVFGPAQLGDSDDPIQRLHAERRQKAAEAQRKRASG